MSRKRKRRGRGSASDANAVQGQHQNDDIEIIDDVNLLGDEATASKQETLQDADAAASEAASADPVVADKTPAGSTSSPSEDPTASATQRSHDAVEAGGNPLAAASAVHVVESLHETPPASLEADRNVETLGELLQHAREAKGLSLEEVSARTRIALPTLRHLENDRFGELPAEAYVKGFLRSYGSFLSLDVSMLLRRYEKLSGHVSTPVAEIWDEVEVDRSGLHVWHPSRRTVAIGGAVLVVAALAWVFWSQGAVMLGLRPAGELQQIEMQLQREAQDGDAPQTSITGLDDAALQTDTDKADGSGVSVTNPPAAAGPSTLVPATKDVKISTVEDTSPPVPQPPVKPLGSASPQTKPPVPPLGPEAQKPAPTEAEKKAADQAAKKPKPTPVKKPVQKPVNKPVKKVAPTPSPEDAAGPPG